ncbi:hypothetical protein KLL18_11545, partial [Clostridioides difficile]|nr:hypothetical protein [Clostridioides difficile]
RLFNLKECKISFSFSSSASPINKKELSLKVNLKTIEFNLDSSCIYDGLNTYIFILLSMFKTSFL